jgi:hypothetical protein
VIEGDIREVNGLDFRGIDLLAGGVPQVRSLKIAYSQSLIHIAG